ncbi:unnamed protein product [Ectocarpus sp. CCAP 1310/34]|nr:unnamed protein product [Ectocarpus sp. CCAP 1310/34]
MAESSSSGLHRMLDSIGKCARRSGFREWKTKLRQAIILHASELLPVLNGNARPSATAANAEDVAAWDKANGRLDIGDGTAVGRALNERFDAQTQEARRACYNELFNLRHLAGGDPIEFFTKGWDLKLRLKVLEEEVSDPVYLDIMLSGLTKAPEFNFIREMHYRDNITSVDILQATANRFLVDQQSRNASGPVVSGRGTSMAVASDTNQCRRCKAHGHFQRDCPQQGQKSRPKQGKKKGANKRGSGGSAQPKWAKRAVLSRARRREPTSEEVVGVHSQSGAPTTTPRHSDAECQKQKEMQENKQKELERLAANLALLQSAGHANFLQFSNIGSAHLAQSSPAVAQHAPSEPTSFGLESGDVAIPMQTLGVDTTTGKRKYSIEVNLEGEPGGPTVLEDAPDALALKVESADLWHRRMGHINGKSSDVLRKEPVNGVDYIGDLKDCAYGVLRPFQNVSVDTLGPFKPTALGGFKYATKFVDQQTKWVDIVLMKDRTCSADSLALFNKGTVVPNGERIHCLLSPGRKRTKSKWVFKRKEDGSFKGRLVAQGWNQVPGLDCGSTYAPVCRLQSIRMLACIAVQFNLELDQMDVSTAFLYADILEKLFVEQPLGFEVRDNDGGDLVMQLQKSLYGLAQSPRNWFHTIDPFLVEIGFVPLKFKMTDMGEVKLVLGMETKRERNQGTLTISQEAYSKSILERFGMSECKPTSTPGYGSELSNKQPEDTLLGEEETRPYQGIVGCLMYIAQLLRYDIMYATSQLARPMAKPSKIHMMAAKHTLRYVAGSTDFRITFKS